MSAGSSASLGESKSCLSAGSRNGLMPIPISHDVCPAALSTDRPKISTTQSSPQRSCSGSSSKPASHNAAIERADSAILQRISTRPEVGSQPSKRGCSSRTSCPSLNRCWPYLLPVGPDQLPDWTAEQRSGGWCSPGSHTGWWLGISSTRQESSIRYDAVVAARELQAGR